MKATRIIDGTFVPPAEITTAVDISGGNSGNIPIEKAVVDMGIEIKKGKSEREAARVVAKKTGLNEGSLRTIHRGPDLTQPPEKMTVRFLIYRFNTISRYFDI